MNARIMAATLAVAVVSACSHAASSSPATAPATQPVAAPPAASPPAASLSGYPPPQPIPAVAEPNAIPLYDGLAPGSSAAANPEQWELMFGQRSVRNVSRPTLTPFLPAPDKATGTAVIVAPGGAYLMLSMDNEGWPVAQRLADAGIAAFVLKYRLDQTPPDVEGFMRMAGERFGAAAQQGPNKRPRLHQPLAIDDMQAAIRMVRSRATEWNVDPQRVGALGFSAGAFTVLGATQENETGARPDFVGLIYGPMIAAELPSNPPALFAALASDDPLVGRDGFGLVESWRAAGSTAELHVYEKGDHGFGTRRTGTSSELWFEQFVTWLRSGGRLGAVSSPNN